MSYIPISSEIQDALNKPANTTGGLVLGGTALANTPNYVIVQVTDNPATNATNLTTAYNAASASTFMPNGLAKSATNRAVVLIPAGRFLYAPGVNGYGLTMDYDFVDLQGISSDASHVVITSDGRTLKQDASNIRIANLTLESTSNANTDAAYYPEYEMGYGLERLENVVALSSNPSTGARPHRNVYFAGTYIDCRAGTGTDEESGLQSFGGTQVFSGTATNCIAGAFSFGSGSGGSFTGTATNCVAGSNSFGSDGAFTGTLYKCRITSGSFSSSGSGTLILCSDGSGVIPKGKFAKGDFTELRVGDFLLGVTGGNVTLNATNGTPTLNLYDSVTLGASSITLSTGSLLNLYSCAATMVGTVQLNDNRTMTLGNYVYTFPEESSTMATLAGSEALTNKTYEGLTITTSTGTLTVADNKTVTLSNTFTLTGSDSGNYNLSAFAVTSANLSQFASTTSAQLADVISDETGFSSGAVLVFSKSPTLETPILGVASVTSVNKVAITAPTTSATLTIANGATLATTGAFSSTFAATANAVHTLPAADGSLATLLDLYTQRVSFNREDFCGGTNTDGQIGQLGWRTGNLNGSGGSGVYLESLTGHPGIFTITTAAVYVSEALRDARGIWLGGSSVAPFSMLDYGQEALFSFQMTSIANVAIKIGWTNSTTSFTPTRGQYLSFETVMGDVYFMYVTKDGGAETRTSSGIAPSTGWFTVKIRNISGTSAGFSISTAGGAFSTEVVLAQTLAGWQRFPIFSIANGSAAAKTLHVDFFSQFVPVIR